jgi:hypothetical protein
MPKYRVHVEEVLNRDTIYEIEANNPEEAEDMLSRCGFNQDPVSVEEDGMHYEVYVSELDIIYDRYCVIVNDHIEIDPLLLKSDHKDISIISGDGIIEVCVHTEDAGINNIAEEIRDSIRNSIEAYLDAEDGGKYGMGTS